MSIAADPDGLARANRPSRSRGSSFIKTVFPRPPNRAVEELPFTETLAAPRGHATTHHKGYAQSGVVPRQAARYLSGNPRKRENSRTFQAFQVFFDARSHVTVIAGQRYRTAEIRCRAAGAP